MVTIPTIQDLRNNLLNSLETEYNITIADPGYSFLEALAGVLAAQLYMNYLAVGDTQKNIWPDTADSVSNGGTLERFGFAILGRYPAPAVAGVYTATVTGTVGAVVPGSSVFKADDTSQSPGALYQIQGGNFTLATNPDDITVYGLAGGLTFGLAVGNTLTATSPITNVDSIITIATVVTDPVDAESLEEYRAKILEKIKLTPGSWSAVDYRLVGVNVTGVKQTYAYANSGMSAVVDVYLQGNTDVPYPGPSVSPAIIADYQADLELVLPLSVWDVNYYSCPINNIDVTITMGSFTPFSVSQQADILAALTNFVNSVHPFIAAADAISDRNDLIAVFNLNAVVAAAVPGYGFAGVTFTVQGVPLAQWVADRGNIPYLNSVSYV